MKVLDSIGIQFDYDQQPEVTMPLYIVTFHNRIDRVRLGEEGKIISGEVHYLTDAGWKPFAKPYKWGIIVATPDVHLDYDENSTWEQLFKDLSKHEVVPEIQIECAKVMVEQAFYG